MEALRKIISDLGFLNCESYIQSGNLVFDSELIDNELIAVKISNAIQTHFDFTVPTLVIKKEEFIKALNETRYQYPKTHHDNAHWLNKVIKNYKEHTGSDLVTK